MIETKKQAERLWLEFFNRAAYQAGVITEKEATQIKLQIYKKRPEQNRAQTHDTSSGL